MSDLAKKGFISPSDTKLQNKLAETLPVLAHQALTCGLLKTHNLLNQAVKEIGWEIASRRDLEDKLLRKKP